MNVLDIHIFEDQNIIEIIKSNTYGKKLTPNNIYVICPFYLCKHFIY